LRRIKRLRLRLRLRKKERKKVEEKNKERLRMIRKIQKVPQSFLNLNLNLNLAILILRIALITGGIIEERKQRYKKKYPKI
jgi:hypothetical protein